MLDNEVEELLKQIGSDLRTLEQLLRSKGIFKTKIEFPGGIITKSWTYREILPYIYDDCLRRNISYHLMLDDIFQWLLRRFNFYLVAEAMLIKTAIVNFGAIFEAILKNVSSCFRKDRKETKEKDELGVSRACTILTKNGVISKESKKDIMWVWGIRNKQHLVLLKNWEYVRYEITDYDRAIDTYNRLIAELNTAFEEGKLKRKFYFF